MYSNKIKLFYTVHYVYAIVSIIKMWNVPCDTFINFNYFLVYFNYLFFYNLVSIELKITKYINSLSNSESLLWISLLRWFPVLNLSFVHTCTIILDLLKWSAFDAFGVNWLKCLVQSG